jgi:hypothetical protein
MKDEGQMLPGAADLLCLWRDGSGAIELKRPAERTLLGKRPAGRPTDAQKEFAALCERHAVRHVYATTWEEVYAALKDWGRLPKPPSGPLFSNPEIDQAIRQSRVRRILS